MKIEQAGVIVDPQRDNVAVAKRDLSAGEAIALSSSRTLELKGPVKKAWRFALADIQSGAPVLQYGWPIGVSKGIKAGDPVTPSNLESVRVPWTANANEQNKFWPPDTGGLPASWQGFVRPDGQVGSRNFILIAPNSMCASHEALQISTRAEYTLWSREKFLNVDGVTAIPHDKGCGCTDGTNVNLVLNMLASYIAHPNVGAAILLELGCEKTNLAAMERHLGKPLDQWGKPVVVLSVQKLGGTEPTIKAGLAAVEKLLPEANKTKRTTVPVSKLSIGLKCGGSDAFSGITANPALGRASDMLVALGGTSMITEVPEMAGCEDKLYKQAVSPAAAQEIKDAITWYDQYAARYGHTAFENPSPGNKDGGLVNILVKSLGAVAKCGHAPLQGVNAHAMPPRGPGMWIMQGPSYDQLSTPALIAAGAQTVLFTTGRGTTIGNAIAPVIKIASNSETYKRMSGDIDIDAGTILDDLENHEQVGRRIYNEIVDVCSGRQAKSEKNMHREFQIWSEQAISL